MILGNVFDVNVTALVTGLGIGGVAFALASKGKSRKSFWFLYYFL